MARILSVSYDDTLLRTRQWMLERDGHSVTSGIGFQQAQRACSESGFDLFILGHSIPHDDKQALISCFQAANPDSLVIALTRAGESRLKEVNVYVNPGNPDELMNVVNATLRGMRRVK